MASLERAFGEWVVNRRWWIIIAAIVVVSISASGMRFLVFNNDTRVFFSKENPQLQALEALENTFSKEDNVYFVVAPKNGKVFTRETLAAIEELTELSWGMPYSSRVDSITNYQHTQAEEDDLLVEDLVENAAGLSDADIDRIKKIALSEPLLVNRMISPSGHVTAVNVNVHMPGKSMDEIPEVTAFTREMGDNFRAKYPNIDLYLSGGVIFDNAFSEAAKDDMATLVPAMFVALIIITGLAIRSVAGTFGTFIVIVISVTTALGLAGWMGMEMNMGSVNAPIIILTLAVADSIHFLIMMVHQMHKGKTKREAIAESIRVNVQPIFLTSVTTAIGFLTMNFSDAPPFRDLGNMVAMGMMAAFVFSITLLPAMMAVLPVRIKAEAKPQSGSDCRSCDSLASFVINRRTPIFWGTLVLIAVLASGMFRIDLNDNWVKYFDKRYDIRIASDFLIDNLTGFDLIEYSMESGESGGINDPDYLAKVEEFANWYRTQSKVVHVNAFTDTMKRLNKNMNGDDEAFYSIPEKRELAAQYLLLYEMSLPFGLDLNNRINVDKSTTRMTVTLKDTNTKELRVMDERARGWLKANAPGMFTYGASLSIIFSHISERNINSMLSASFLALVLISGILIIALRSFKLGLASLVPNLGPAFMAFGVWGFAVGQVGLSVSVIIAMTLGIVVDDTVHFMSKYLRGRREHNLSSPDAVRYAFDHVGTALWVTTLALTVGFLILSLSGFKLNSDMGMMTAITIVMALALDFLFLPTLLMKVDGAPDEEAVKGKLQEITPLGEPLGEEE